MGQVSKPDPRGTKVKDAAEWHEQYDRMSRWWARLHAPGEVEQRRDDFYAFFVTCFHLKDWLKNDPAVRKPVRKKIEQLVNDKVSLRLCADIANGVKHLVLTNKKRVRKNKKGVGKKEKEKRVPFDPSARLSIESPGEIVIAAQGKLLNVDMVASRCVLYWEKFLRQEGLL